MRFLHAIEATNFLSLKKVRVELGSLNVLVGPNGAGKTNLLTVIQFLGDVARLDLQPAVQRLGGLGAIRFRGEGSQVADLPGTIGAAVEIRVEAVVTQHANAVALDEYDLSMFEVPATKLYMAAIGRAEEFKFKRTKGSGRRITVSGAKIEVKDERNRQASFWELGKTSAALSTLQRLGEDQGARQVRELAQLFETFRVFEVDVDKARLAAPLEDEPKLAANGSNVAAFLAWLRQAHPDTLEALEDDLRVIVPGFEKLHFEPVGGATEAVALHLSEHGLKGTTPLARASFGTVRVIALLAMLHDPNPPKLTCVEEIDHGLHPYALDRIVERLREATARTQILLATHSPTLVNRLRPEELIVCERDPMTGESRIPAISPAEVAAVAEGDSLGLGEIWFSGTLGGVPA